ncbi:hypothetical protein Vretimale_12287 [Volvox reticuliferus]|uniref:Uncharacterized protein n=1 Tax=Volvox reticuliferus TaxID=1737510 RepID=A0A8J4CDG6_9CHLO|nr:hypothetical protein Vretifemale_8880 [Volvox reticuliferus]GIM08238.1 hypothetical protein Vretimale_12287 [Volvox reticuliferus]
MTSTVNSLSPPAAIYLQKRFNLSLQWINVCFFMIMEGTDTYSRCSLSWKWCLQRLHGVITITQCGTPSLSVWTPARFQCAPVARRQLRRWQGSRDDAGEHGEVAAPPPPSSSSDSSFVQLSSIACVKSLVEQHCCQRSVTDGTQAVSG